jgi:hypothetical protein
LQIWLRGEEAPKAAELFRAQLDRYMTKRFESRKAQCDIHGSVIYMDTFWHVLVEDHVISAT